MFKLVFVLVCFAVSVLAVDNPVCAGCHNKVEGEALKHIENQFIASFDKLKSDKDFHYKFVKINSATSQVVAGSIYRINADLKDSKNDIKTCDVEMLIPLKEPVRLIFECPGHPKLIKTHSQ